MVSARKMLIFAGVLFALWLGVQYILPLLLPFLFGLALALAAEPAVALAEKHLKLKRSLAAGLGVTATLLLFAALAMLLGALAVKELIRLAAVLPDLGEGAQKGMLLLQDGLVQLTQKAPEGLSSMLTGSVLRLFDDSSALMEQVVSRLPGAVSAVLGWVPQGALGVGTAVLSGFLISGRLPQIRSRLRQFVRQERFAAFAQSGRRIRKAVGGWCKAQLKLSAVTYAVVALGLFVLRVEYAFGWALPIAVVDAVPVLGTGTVLVPWAAVCLLQGDGFRAIGLLGTYGVALVLRTVLEPRLVGKHLGLDPLLTLLGIYIGYRLWGILGMIFAPMLLTAVRSILQLNQKG